MSLDSVPRIAIVGLGYVGLPVAVAFAEQFEKTVGFDIDAQRVDELRSGFDRTHEIDGHRLKRSGLHISVDSGAMVDANFFIVTVPTPIDGDLRPDLGALRSASETVGHVMQRHSIVVYESTVYPGVTEDVCGPILERASGLSRGADFKLAYSPERINPGDRDHRFEKIVKIVSAEDGETADVVARTYGKVIEAEIYRAPSIAVAEAAKVIENIQRDLNIALTNELAMIFERLDLDTSEVLDAAATKWNFHRFSPGLVGGHCIGVDPYYLTSRAEQVGFLPQVILAGRRINDAMGEYVAENAVKRLVRARVNLEECSVLIAGVSFKENVPDFRNTRVVSIVRYLADYGLDVTVWDPLCDVRSVREEYGIELEDPGDPAKYAAIILAVPHDEVVRRVSDWFAKCEPLVFIDVKGAVDRDAIPDSVSYWRL